MSIGFVFFDAGETLVHPYPSFAELFAAVCQDEGVHVEADDVRVVQERLAPYLIDQDDEEVRYSSISPVESERFWLHLYRRFLRELDVENAALERRLYARFSDVASYKLFDDVLPALDGLLEQGYRLGVISNFEGWLQEMLVELQVGHLFELAVISGVAGVEKPDPKIYEIALDSAAVAADEAVHIGDSMTLDVEPARSVGMHAILLDRAGRVPNSDAPRITTLEDLPMALANLDA